MNDLDIRSIQIALRDIDDAKRELEFIGKAAAETAFCSMQPVIKHLANTLALVAATECRSLDAQVSSLTRAYMSPSTNPLAKKLHEQSGRLTKVIRALDALNDEARRVA